MRTTFQKIVAVFGRANFLMKVPGNYTQGVPEAGFGAEMDVTA